MLADLGRRDHRGASGKRRACPMSGRRAPELAAGALLQCMDELWDTHSASLLVQHSRHLSHTDKLRVLGDWESGRQAFHFYVTVKLAPWQSLPLCLCGIAHMDIVVARRCAVDSLSVIDGLQEDAVTHPLVRRFGGALRKDVEAMIAGEEPSAELKFELACLRFIPIVERQVLSPEKQLLYSSWRRVVRFSK